MNGQYQGTGCNDFAGFGQGFLSCLSCVRLGVMTCTLLLCGCFTTIYGSGADRQDDDTTWPEDQPVPWVVNTTQAAQLLRSGATLWDARTPKQRAKGPLTGARVVTWQQFSEPELPNMGKLLEDDAALSAQLQQTGVEQARPVVVIGDPVAGWGEDGRLVWMLREVGHTKVTLVDGGAQALQLIWTEALSQAIYQGMGDMVAKRLNKWDIDAETLKAKWSNDEVTLLDTRELREYNGETPYGEMRGGHVPGALHLYYKALIDKQGKLLPRQVLLDKLKTLGLEQDNAVVAYCTGGVRSGWFVAVLIWLGFTQVTNYAGSMWEWSSLPETTYPLD